MTDAPRPPWDGQSGPPGPDPDAPPPYSMPDAPGPGFPPPPAPEQGFGSAPPPGYPPAGYPPGPGMVPQGYANNDEKTWALVAHFGGAAAMFLSGGWLGWVPPLVAMLAKGQQSPTVRAHAVSALNFQLLWSIIGAVGFILGLCGSLIVIGAVFFIAPFVAWIMGTVFGIIAGVRANEGQFYRYPMTVTFIK